MTLFDGTILVTIDGTHSTTIRWRHDWFYGLAGDDIIKGAKNCATIPGGDGTTTATVFDCDPVGGPLVRLCACSAKGLARSRVALHSGEAVQAPEARQ